MTATRTSDARPSASTRRALLRRSLADGRIRTIAFAYIFAIYSYIQPAGYRTTYKTVAERMGFAHSFADNVALRLFYGQPHDLLTVSGYASWRVGGTLVIVSAIWGVVAAVRPLRTEEDSGRTELVLAGAVSRGALMLSAGLAITAGALFLGAVSWAGLVVGGLPAGGSLVLALAIIAPIPVFAGVGALASQLAPRRRIAMWMGFGAVAVALLIRAVADTASGAAWLRWLTPLGWAEEIEPFIHPRPALVLTALAAGAALFALAWRISEGRDVGSGLLPSRDSAAPRFTLLSSPTAQALRSEFATIVVWVLSIGVFAYILGAVSTSITSAGISKQLERQISKLGAGSISTTKGYLGFVFLVFVLAISLFACSQIAAAREEELDGQLETLLALGVGRRRWFAGRLALAAGAATVISLAGGLLTLAGAAMQGASLSLGSMLLASINCLPVSLLALGAGAVAFAVVPRASAGIAYGLVALAFLWDLIGSLVSVPQWVLGATPFAHVGLVPGAAFRGQAAAIMVAIALLLGAFAVALFERRDLIS